MRNNEILLLVFKVLFTAILTMIVACLSYKSGLTDGEAACDNYTTMKSWPIRKGGVDTALWHVHQTKNKRTAYMCDSIIHWGDTLVFRQALKHKKQNNGKIANE